MNNVVYHADALTVLNNLPSESVDLVYTDPPFGTGNIQQIQRKELPKRSYSDKYDDYLGFLVPHLLELHRVLKQTGTLYLHLDYRWAHYAKVELDKIFGDNNFLNEVIWSYNFGGRGKDRWPAKHDIILVFAKSKGKHVFNWETCDRIPYLTPALQYVGRTKEDAEKRIAKGQVPTDVWTDIPILGTAAKERIGYPNQKPVKLIERAITASSNPGDLVLDIFGGSGTTAIAAHNQSRNFIIVDQNPQSVEVIKSRLDALQIPATFVL